MVSRDLALKAAPSQSNHDKLNEFPSRCAQTAGRVPCMVHGVSGVWVDMFIHMFYH